MDPLYWSCAATLASKSRNCHECESPVDIRDVFGCTLVHGKNLRHLPRLLLFKNAGASIFLESTRWTNQRDLRMMVSE